MRQIISYIYNYYNETNKTALVIISLFTAVLIFCNYFYDIDTLIRKNISFGIKLFYWYIVFGTAFIIPYLITIFCSNNNFFRKRDFFVLLIVSPLIFAWKITASPTIPFSVNESLNDFANHILYWPFLAVIIFLLLYLAWKVYSKEQALYGLYTKTFDWKPYILMLFFMVPLIFLAATQNDFLSAYPKLNTVSSATEWWQKILFELSYGTDFFTIEFFFRGFLVLAFAKWAGKNAILPMACFYCTIHFGKPLGECISSYFGGILLGIVVYNTRSIWGGLIVHLGIAWLMEIAGYLGNNIK